MPALQGKDRGNGKGVPKLRLAGRKSPGVMGTEPGRTALNFGIALLSVSGALAVFAWLLFPARIALLCSVPLAFIGLVGLSFLIAEGVRRANTP